MKAENLSQSNETSSSKKGSDLFDEELFKECLKRDLHAKPVGGQKLNDFGRQMYTSAREATCLSLGTSVCFTPKLVV